MEKVVLHGRNGARNIAFQHYMILQMKPKFYQNKNYFIENETEEVYLGGGIPNLIDR